MASIPITKADLDSAVGKIKAAIAETNQRALKMKQPKHKPCGPCRTVLV